MDLRLSVTEWGILLTVLAALGAASLWRLGEMVVPDMDEGVYVYAGKLIAEGSRPYRDFMLAHPPLVPYLAAAAWVLGGGSLDFTRLFAVAVTLASCIPLYLLARRIAATAASGFLAVCIYLVGLVWIANLGRTIRLEPIQNALLIGGAAAWMLGTRRRSAFVAGLLLAAAVSAKLTSVVPIGLLAIAELAWPSGGRADGERRRTLVLGAVLLLGPLTAWCVAQDGFIEWVFRAQVGRPRETLAERSAAFFLAVARFPVLLPGFLLAAWQLRAPDPRRRTLAVVALGSSVAAVLIFHTFFRHYLALALPWLAILMGAWGASLRGGRTPRWLVPAAVAAAFLSPIGFTELSFRLAPEHSSGAATVLPHLRAGRGYLLTSAPDFALVSGRTLLPWYFTVDNYLGRVTGRLTDAEFASAVSRAGTVVLYRGEAGRLPLTQALLAERFRQLPVDPHWEAWEAIPAASR